MFYLFFFSSRRRHTSCALVTGVQTCALPIYIGGYRGLEFTDSFWGMTAVKNANDMLGAGFTTVRNVGSDNRNDIGLKQAIDAGYATGPRIVPAGYALGATGGHCASTYLRSEEHTSELQSLKRISYTVFCLEKNKLIST